MRRRCLKEWGSKNGKRIEADRKQDKAVRLLLWDRTIRKTVVKIEESKKPRRVSRWRILLSTYYQRGSSSGMTPAPRVYLRWDSKVNRFSLPLRIRSVNTWIPQLRREKIVQEREIKWWSSLGVLIRTTWTQLVRLGIYLGFRSNMWQIYHKDPEEVRICLKTHWIAVWRGLLVSQLKQWTMWGRKGRCTDCTSWRNKERSRRTETSKWSVRLDLSKKRWRVHWNWD